MDEPRCPECGQHFDPDDSTTYTTKPPFVFWRYWLPPILMTATMVAVWAVLFQMQGVAIAATLIVPFSLGGMFGYGTRERARAAIGTAILAAVSAMIMLMIAGFQGMFCAFILFLIILVPVGVGVGCGFALRAYMKRTTFSQKSHLPLWFFVALPLVWGYLEGPTSTRYGQIVITTSQIMPVNVDQAWDGVTMYEDVKHSPPLLLRLGLSRPLYSRGSMTHVGDVKTCVYDQGKLVKRITKVDPGKTIEFEVVEQTIERCGAKLKGGSFSFEQVGPNETRVTLRTVYEPFLAPRFAWQPFEALSAHTLHNHVLLGMADNAVHPQPHRETAAAVPGDLPIMDQPTHDHHAHP